MRPLGEVELDIFSGMPNPSWHLKDEDVDWPPYRVFHAVT
jgi:hypothetical protein